MPFGKNTYRCVGCTACPSVHAFAEFYCAVIMPDDVSASARRVTEVEATAAQQAATIEQASAVALYEATQQHADDLGKLSAIHAEKFARQQHITNELQAQLMSCKSDLSQLQQRHEALKIDLSAYGDIDSEQLIKEFRKLLRMYESASAENVALLKKAADSSKKVIEAEEHCCAVITYYQHEAAGARHDLAMASEARDTLADRVRQLEAELCQKSALAVDASAASLTLECRVKDLPTECVQLTTDKRDLTPVRFYPLSSSGGAPSFWTH